jgi:hypothetical protein
MFRLSLLLLIVSAGVASTEDKADDSPRSAIHDPKKLYSPSAVKEAENEIRRIKQKTGVDLYIEMTNEMPGEFKEERRAWFKNQARAEAMDKWAMDRAEALYNEGIKIDGLYIIIIDAGPGKRDVRVVPWPAGRGGSQGLSSVKRRRLREILLTGLTEDRDRSLARSIDVFQDQLRRIREAPPSPLDMNTALIVVGGLVGGWLLLMAARWQANGNIQPGDPEPVAIYQPAMMGTLFGVPASFWVNDELFRALPPEVTPAPPTGYSDRFSMPPATETPPEAFAPPEPFTLPPPPDTLGPNDPPPDGKE